MSTTTRTVRRERRPVTLVHVMKKRLRSALAPATPFSATASASSNSPNTQLVPAFPSSDTPQASRRMDPNAESPAVPSAPHNRQQPRPEALATPDFYNRFPRAVGPLANVVITTDEEYKMMLLTARHITVVRSRWERDASAGRLCEEDLLKGGFFVYRPESVSPQYFELLTCASDVYGSSAYVSG